MTPHALKLYDESLTSVRVGDVSGCIQRAIEALASLENSPFHVALELGICNPPAEAAEHICGLVRQERMRFEVAAVYAEMNGFDINPERWFFDLFAYEEHGGHDDYNWLADWQSGDYPDMTIVGMEPLQAVYASPAFHDERFREAREVTDLLVIFKFQELMSKAAKCMSRFDFPLLATAHDFDLILEVPSLPHQGNGPE